MLKNIITLIISLMMIQTAFADEKKAPEKAPEKKAAPDAAKLLSTMDDNYNKHKDMQMLMTVKLFSDGKLEKVIKASVKQKGGDKRILRILEPGESAGMAILSVDADTMYVYLPQFQRIRRVAAHAKKNSFLGSDFTQQEMAILRYDNLFNAKLLEETKDSYILELKPKEGKEFEASKLKMWIKKSNGLFSKVEYYNLDGKKAKTQFREQDKNMDGGFVQPYVKMVDHLKNHYTEMILSEVKVNNDFPDSLFSKRNLEWGE